MTLTRGDELISSDKHTCILFGPSKNGGKTTIALSGPGNILHFQYSPGTISIPPGKDPKEIWVKQYDFDADEMDAKTDKWKRTKEPYQVMEDIDQVVEGFRKGGPIKIDNTELPFLPDQVNLDDGVLLHDYVVAWICAVNNIADPTDWKQWGKRTQIMVSLIRRIMKLPCSSVFTTWETIDKNADGKVIERWPDVGGKLDFRAIGLADAGLYCYSEKEGTQIRFKVRTRSNGIIQGCGVRGLYDLPETIDVTIDPKKPTSPWQKIWQRS